jgi:shikimate kinase
MLARREPIYQAAADHMIDVTKQQPKDTVDEAVRLVNQATEGAV